jgi:CGNR zinc finger
MPTAQERLEFAVNFAQMELSNLRPGDLLNLRDDFMKFFYPMKQGEDLSVGAAGIIVTPFAQPFPQDYTLDNFTELQKEVKRVLDELVTGKTPLVEAPGDSGPLVRTRITSQYKIEAKYHAIAVPGLEKSGAMLQAMGPTRDMFLLRLFNLVSREPFDRILRCKASDCERIFYRKRKQEYCSTKCTNRAYMKDYRKGSNYAQSAAEQAHERYKKRMKKLHGKKHTKSSVASGNTLGTKSD